MLVVSSFAEAGAPHGHTTAPTEAAERPPTNPRRLTAIPAAIVYHPNFQDPAWVNDRRTAQSRLRTGSPQRSLSTLSRRRSCQIGLFSGLGVSRPAPGQGQSHPTRTALTFE